MCLVIEPCHHVQLVSSLGNLVNIQVRPKSLDPKPVSATPTYIHYTFVPCGSTVSNPNPPGLEEINLLFVGMAHRSKKRSRNDTDADDGPSSRIHGNMTSAQGESVNYSISGAMESPRSFHHRQSSMPSRESEYRRNSTRPLDTSGLPSPVSTITTPLSHENSDRKNSKLLEIIHPSHEPAPESPQAWDQQVPEDQDVNRDTTRQLILDVCEDLQISFLTYQYLYVKKSLRIPARSVQPRAVLLLLLPSFLTSLSEIDLMPTSKT
jgi:hypothetical protein